MKLRAFLVLGFCMSLIAISCDDEENQRNSLTPRVDFTISPEAPLNGDEIVFTTEVIEPSSDIVSWHWSFFDHDSTTSTEQNPTFVYERPGTYHVTLDVVDANDNALRIAKPVVVGKMEFPATLVWEFTNNTAITNVNEGSNAPAIGDDGTIYYVEGNAGAESKVVAVNDLGTTAELKWATAIGHQLSNAPSIDGDGNVFINSWLASAGISKLNGQTGAIIWSASTVAGVSNNTAAIDSEGNTYHGTRSNALAGAFSWTPEGQKRWEIIGVGAFYAAPVLSADGSTVYFLNTDTGKIWAVNTADGSQKWASPVGTETGGHGSSLSIGEDGTVYFTTNQHVAAVTDNGTTGALKWATEVTGPANSGVVIGPSGDLYTGSLEGLVSLNPDDGSINWTYDAEIRESVPAVDVNGNVYVGTVDGTLLIVNDWGGLQKEMLLADTDAHLADNVINSPTIASDGTVYIEGRDGPVIRLFKIAVENSGPAVSPWPMKGQNVKNTGKAM
jgi:outer membrane protein assembly factor BamB